MIARIFIQLLLMIVLPDIYIDAHYLRHRKNYTWWKRMLWWLPCIVLVAYTVALASARNFAPAHLLWLNIYLLLVGLIVYPKTIFTVSSLIGWAYCRVRHTRVNKGNYVGVVLSLVGIYILLYGCFIGIREFNVKHADFYSADLPRNFDGYRIVLFSDAHVGTYTGSYRKILERAVDSISAQHADVIIFAGDLQNMRANEIIPVSSLLASLHARDGVFSVLGNHDYSHYVMANTRQRIYNEGQTVTMERMLGWDLLLNENRILRRGQDSIVIAGEENDGLPPFPSRGDIHRTMSGIGDKAFTVFVEHDPTAWRRSILPGTKAQLTLSGHTHAGQFEVFGWSPAKLVYSEWHGMTLSGDRAIYVSGGLGGFVPFRFGVPGEINVITLHCKK